MYLKAIQKGDANPRLNEFRARNSLNTPFLFGGQFVGAAFPTWASSSLINSSSLEDPFWVSLFTAPQEAGLLGAESAGSLPG